MGVCGHGCEKGRGLGWWDICWRVWWWRGRRYGSWSLCGCGCRLRYACACFLGTSVGQLVLFYEVNVAPGITGMATGGGFWVLVVWSSHSHSWAEVGSPSAKIGEVVNVVIPFVTAVSTHVSPRD